VGSVGDDGCVASTPSTRSIKISADERTGWSSERPRKEGVPERPIDVSVRCRVLAPSDRLRYSPGSLLLIVSADPDEAVRVAERVVEERGAVLTLAKVRKLLSTRVAPEELDTRALEVLDGAVAKRLGASQTVIVVTETLDAAERERYVRVAHGLKRPRHLLLLETSRDRVPEELRAPLNELRRALDAGEAGLEGFQTALRLGGGAVAELKRIVFRPLVRDD
jgi:hypothetical protein